MIQNISESLFKEFLNGNEMALRRIIDDESKKLLANIKRLIKTESDAKEISQDIFLEIWNKRAEFNSLDALYGFIYSRARFKSLDFLKKRNASIVDPYEFAGKLSKEISLDAETLYQAEELALIISIAIGRMPRQRQKVFTMTRIEGLKRAEIARQLGISPDTVSQHLTRAMEDLKRIIFLLIIIISS